MNRNIRNSQSDTGFTIIELMIAMAFIATLLLAIVATVMQIGTVYNKGVAMKSVNQAGRSVVADLKRTIGEGLLFTVPDPTGTDYGRTDPFLLQDINGDILPLGSDDAYGGRLCTGGYSYVWNIGKHIDDSPNKYDAGSTKQLRLAKVRDPGGHYCKDKANDTIPTDATELLSENSLAVEDFNIEALTHSPGTGFILYNMSILIGSANQDEIDSVGMCKPPEDAGSYQNYCAVNRFVFTARAGNGGGQ